MFYGRISTLLIAAGRHGAQISSGSDQAKVALAEIDRLITAGFRFGCVLADAGYGLRQTPKASLRIKLNFSILKDTTGTKLGHLLEPEPKISFIDHAQVF